MKNLTSKVEGSWCNPIVTELTEEQKRLLQSVEEVDEVAKSELLETLKENRENPANTEDSDEAQTVYELHKPVLEQTDTYQLIAVDLSIDSFRKTGIINCRINGVHKQIRF
jgi:type II secretory ATPase GspE/PulE/Tfp pilus assembly ATPase PilB-like protein